MTAPDRAYLVLTLERTGSGVLCDALDRTGMLGSPYELFGADMHRRATELGVVDESSTAEAPRPSSLPAYVNAIARQTMRGGVFGAKLHRYQYDQLERNGLVSSPLDLVPATARSAPRLVLLTRRDRRRQAISILLARATGVWGLVEDPGGPRMELPGNPYWANRLNGSPQDLRASLDQILDTIVQHEHAWLRWIETSGVNAMAVTYEQLSEDYANVVADVASYVGGVDLEASAIPTIRLRQQRDERTEALLRLWRQDEAASE